MGSLREDGERSGCVMLGKNGVIFALHNVEDEMGRTLLRPKHADW